ncbi:MAG: hypothetical protein GTN59_05765, partial [Candidatus Dadabacteria bacterium]|nr:hypothetical protein [Candidatus Dadabacteria bacterium]
MNYIYSLLLLFLCSFVPTVSSIEYDSKDPKQLIQKMTDKTGTYEKLLHLRDVQYKYTTTDSKTGAEEVSIERYIFDGELSWARFIKHELHVFPDKKGEVIQGYNGKESWVTLDGQLVEDPAAIKLADFLRKTNFYWFSMMQKLLDPGIIYTYGGKKTVNGIDYDTVKIEFESGVGDVSDTYLLYINRNTNLIDQFLFTVMNFNITEPYLMKLEYEEVNGLLLPAKRKLTKSNWNGDILEDSWTHEIMTEIKFNNNFK